MSNENESSGGFREIFAKIMAAPLTNSNKYVVLKAAWIDTVLGTMLTVSDDHALYLLEFIDSKNLKLKIEKLKHKTKAIILVSSSEPIISIEKELKEYFAGDLKEFKTPIYLHGSDFQKQAWNELTRIAYGETSSYLNQATAIGRPSSYRAVANANGANKFAILVPCHRIINDNGKIGGYGGGLHRKRWLLEHEMKNR